MTDRRRFRGVGVALVTPFREDGSVDEEAFRAHVEEQIRAGTNVLVPCGTTGEAPTLEPGEQKLLVEETVTAAAGRAPVMAGAAAPSTAGAIGLARAARDAGADAILAGTPPYNRPSQEGLYAHFRAVAEEGGLPIFVYNVPGRTAVNLEPDTVLRLAELQGVWGVKEASGDLSQVMTILRDRPEDFLVLSGDDELAFPMLAMGADGVISVAANEVPDDVVRMVHDALEGRYDDAVRLHFRLLTLMRANFVETNPVPVKAALAAGGRMSDTVRRPLVSISDAGRRKVEEAMASLGSGAAAS